MKEDKKETKKDVVKNCEEKQLRDLWYLIEQINTQASLIRSKSKNKLVRDEALIMMTRIETIKQVYFGGENKVNETSN